MKDDVKIKIIDGWLPKLVTKHNLVGKVGRHGKARQNLLGKYISKGNK